MHSSPGSRLIVVTGMPGTGKSTFARQLAARLAVSLLSKDLVKECLFEALGSGDAPSSNQTGARIDGEFLDLPGERLAYDATRTAGLIERIERWSAGAT
jgi:hypothetical protein